MSATLIVVLVVIGAYLAAHVAFEWLARRFMVVSGAEYLLLGVLLGPEVTGLISPRTVGGFAPLMMLALGWIGAVIGAQFFIPALVRIRGMLFQVAFTEAVLSLVLVSTIMGAILLWLFPLTPGAAVVPAVALGAIATASAPSGIAVVSQSLGRRGRVVQQLEVATAVDAAVAIVAFGLLLSIVHVTPDVVPRAPTATEWAVIGVGIGVVGGALFHLFLWGERQIDRLFIALAGAIILASGAAAYLGLSPLLPTMLIGAILVNTSSNRGEIKEVLGRVERPLYFVLLIFAGAAWQPEVAGWVLPVLLFLVVRLLTKLSAAWVAAAACGALGELGAGWGRALLGQGGLAVAIALNYRLHEDALYADIVFTAGLLSVLLTDLLSARAAGAVLLPRLRRNPPVTSTGLSSLEGEGD
ncbi:MAG TPA: hypothetical protein VML95_00165 [Longimicrobiales bacterium]|nr:hypothetical protein [Longimicrobiales bacterium]